MGCHHMFLHVCGAMKNGFVFEIKGFMIKGLCHNQLGFVPQVLTSFNTLKMSIFTKYLLEILCPSQNILAFLAFTLSEVFVMKFSFFHKYKTGDQP